MVGPIVFCLILLLVWLAADIKRVRRSAAAEREREAKRRLRELRERKPPRRPNCMGVLTVSEQEGRIVRTDADRAADEAEEIILDEINRAIMDGTMQASV